MSLEAGIVERLNATALITSLVSGRIYANVLPDNTTKPAIVYQVVSLVPISSLNNDTGKERARVQFTFLSDSTAERVLFATAIKESLQRFKGQVSDITIIDSRKDNLFDQAYDLETNQTARIADFIITYE